MELWIYTPYDHVPCGVIDQYTGLSITHRNIKPGSIEFECPLNDVTRLLCDDALVWPQGDETAYWITTCVKQTESNGDEVLSVKGSCLKWILGMRVLSLPQVFTGKSGAILRQMLGMLTGKRAFPRFSWQVPATLGNDMILSASAESYLTTFQAIAEASSLTLKVLWNSVDRTMVFTAAAGVDRSVSNTAGRPPVLFDETLETIQGIRHTQSVADSKNVMYISDADDVVLEAGAADSAGFRRCEDCTSDSGGKTVTNEDGTTTEMTDEQYRQKKLAEAQKELAKEQPVNSATGDLPAGERLMTYGVDFTLGDVVTVRKTRWNVSADVRITEEELNEKNGEIARTLTLGSKLPTIADRIKLR